MRRFCLVAFLVVFPALAQGQARLLRHPTYSKGRVAFSYLGDIWIAREDGSGVQRLTVHNCAGCVSAVFAGWAVDRVLIQPRGQLRCLRDAGAGGKARQLTFHSADDMVVGWSADGAEGDLSIDAGQRRISDGGDAF